jgi:hypothetical protein
VVMSTDSSTMVDLSKYLLSVLPVCPRLHVVGVVLGVANQVLESVAVNADGMADGVEEDGTPSTSSDTVVGHQCHFYGTVSVMFSVGRWRYGMCDKCLVLGTSRIGCGALGSVGAISAVPPSIWSNLEIIFCCWTADRLSYGVAYHTHRGADRLSYGVAYHTHCCANNAFCYD